MGRAVSKSVLIGAMLVLVAGCLSPSSAVSNTPSGASQLYTLQPTPDRQALQSSAQGYLATLLQEPANQQVTLINADPALVSKDNQDLAITLPDGNVAQFHLRDFTHITDGIDGWVGYKASAWKQQHPSSSSEIDIDPRYYLSIVREGDKVIGTMLVDGQPYRIDYVSPGQHALIKVDASKLPTDAEPLQGLQEAASNETKGEAVQSAHSTIRVLFVTTNQLRAAKPNNRAELAVGLNSANQYFSNTGVPITLELAGYYDANYNETGRTAMEQLNDMRLTPSLSAGLLSVRESLKADLVSMYSTSLGPICGIAWITASQAQGHSVISCSNAVAHELGHNIGLDHPMAYTRTQSPAFHTQMANHNSAIPYFSNLTKTYQGVAMGTPAQDSASRLNQRRDTVANFYPPLPVEPTLLKNRGRFESNGPDNACLAAFVSTIQFGKCQTSANFLWKIEPWPGVAGTARIVTGNGNCMVAGTDNRVTAQTCPAGVINGLLWKVTKVTEDTVRIESHTSGRCLGAQQATPTPELMGCDANSTYQQWVK